MESAVEDFERVRAIFELAVQQSLDMPEIVWKVSDWPSSAQEYTLIRSRRTSTLRRAKARESELDSFTSDYWSEHRTSRCVQELRAGTMC